MNATEIQGEHNAGGFQERKVRTIAGSGVFDTMDAIAVIVLSIVGLAGILASTVAAVATMLLGAFILMQGSPFEGSLAMSQAKSETTGTRGDASAASLAGVAGLILGILSLFGIYPQVLLSVAIIVYGAAFLVWDGAMTRLIGLLVLAPAVGPKAIGGEVLVGVAAVTLGILGAIGLSPLILVSAALLSLGVAVFFARTPVSRHLMRALRGNP